MGTTVSSTTAGFRPPSTPSNSAVTLGGVAHPLRQGPYYDQRVARDPGTGTWQQSQINPNVGEMMFSPNGRASNVPAFGSHPLTTQGQPHTSHADTHSRDQTSNAVSGGQVQQDIRGLSHMSNSGNATTGTPQANPAIGSQGSPNVRSAGMSVQPPVALNGSSSAAIPAMQPGVEKRGPVEFNHAISYVNKIKVRKA